MAGQRAKPRSPLTVDAIGASVCVALSALAYFGAVHPHLAEAAKHASRQAELAQHTATARNCAASRSALQRQLEHVQQRLRDDAPALDDATRLNRRIARLGDLAAACGVGIDEIHVGEIASHEHYQTVPLHLKGRAEFKTAVHFLHRLRRSEPDIGIWSLNLSGNARRAASATTCEFRLAWYAAPPDDS